MLCETVRVEEQTRPKDQRNLQMSRVSPMSGETLTTLTTGWPGDKHFNSQSTFICAKGTALSLYRETPTTNVKSEGGETEFPRSMRGKHAPCRRYIATFSAGAEMGSHMSRLVGGVASLEPTRLYQQFPASGKYTGKILSNARPFAGSFREKPYPERLPPNSAKCDYPEEQGINRELWPPD